MLFVLFLGFLLGWFLRAIYNCEEKDDTDNTTLEQIADYMIETFLGKPHLNEHCVLYRWSKNGSQVETLLRVAEEYERLKTQ